MIIKKFFDAENYIDNDELYIAAIFQFLFGVPYFDENGEKIKYKFIGVD